MHTTVGLLLAVAASANAYVAPGVMPLAGSRSVAMACSLSEGKTRRQALFQVCSLAALLSVASISLVLRAESRACEQRWTVVRCAGVELACGALADMMCFFRCREAPRP